MPTAFPSVGHSGSQSISLLTQTTSTEEHDETTSSCARASSTVLVCQPEQLESTRAQTAAAAVATESLTTDSLTVKAALTKSAPTKSPATTSPMTKAHAATVPLSTVASPLSAQSPVVYHRLAEVRAQQGLSLRTVSRRTGVEVKELKQQEAPGSDLLLSQLVAWQKALEVPLVDLLEDENHALSRPVQERAKMVRIMKTVVSLCEVSASQPRLSRLSTMLREQVLDLMPELAEIGGWPQCGSRRGADVMGRIFHEPVSVEFGGLE